MEGPEMFLRQVGDSGAGEVRVSCRGAWAGHLAGGHARASN